MSVKPVSPLRRLGSRVSFVGELDETCSHPQRCGWALKIGLFNPVRRTCLTSERY